MTENETSLGQNGLPDFKTNWVKITNYLPRFSFLSPPDWKDVLDSIIVTWRDSGSQTEAQVRLLSETLTLPNIPRLELADASEYLESIKGDWGKFVEGVNGIANGVKSKWGEMQELSDVAEKVRLVNSAKGAQVVTLLQVINETHKEGRTPNWIRQRIAQHAFDEIVNTGIYRTLDYSGTDNNVDDQTTQDDFNSEKSELLAALHGKLWTKRENGKRDTIYKNLRMIIFEGDNSVGADVADSLEILWNAANGNRVTRKSALHYLQLAEDIYQDMEEGGAFDQELTKKDENK